MEKNFTNIYFIGIGGISMSALAIVMLDEGCKVSGSDKNNSHIIDKLIKMGAKINSSHKKENITEDIDLVVYTSAISDDNPELLRSKELNLHIMDRAEFLGFIMKNYNNSICVSGTHGKTTTTGMLSSILLETELDPTIFLGGEMDLIDGNFKHGSYNMLLTEACEYKRNFLKFNPTMEIILNIDADHLDYFRDLRDIESAFVEYAQNLPRNGHLVINVEHANLFKNIKSRIVTFGKSEKADFYPANIKSYPTPSYSLMHKRNEIAQINLNIFGEHNILNSVAAAAACIMLNVDLNSIKKGLEKFVGTHRRYEYKGNYKGATIIDDYAHHPSEMKATLETAKSYSKGKVITIFQPHTYSRTKLLLNEFAEALKLSDYVILLDIYAAREKNTGEIQSIDLLKKVNENSTISYYAENFVSAVTILDTIVSKEDTIITMGAGNVNEIINLLSTVK
ncbi:UDP-N-acetylmuramate--L-alanine ligase [Sedimentibacter sp. MB31-C6]|uniref:UDP-N-acetylmuramate--L-alanine ligase n=1 Tax=Sedimentibacter sp. MB31-C6 TaxID=3109366 RepID=UPI002DDD4035|nr:UDP-N-acetylmuramate--L-alanine ligase [Sedimentibacter sp. MB36-C1]WSI03776.1 UDP-N-acetylmuramate--L-alanine ligase [Sedimentibacter sp. MB36-C1]